MSDEAMTPADDLPGLPGPDGFRPHQPDGERNVYSENKLLAYGRECRATDPRVAALNERVRGLENALRIAVTQNEHDMVMTGEELRQCRAALSAREGGA